MIVLDLREAAEAGVSAVGTLPDLDPTERASAIETWRGRMINETISARVFAAMIPQALAANVSSGFLERVARAASDELRHGRQCAAVVKALGGDPVAQIETLAPVPSHDDATPLEALLRNVLSVSCLSETVAVALIGAERLRVGPQGIQATLSHILADEVQHARMGWILVEQLAATLDAATVNRLNAYLIVAFRHLVAHELAHLPEGPPPSPDAMAVGVCDGGEGRTLFFDTVQTIIVPRLQALGFDAHSAWRAAMPRRDVCAA